MATYKTESKELILGDNRLTLINLIPDMHWGERNAVKKTIEQQLYDVFCKYVSSKI